MTTIDNSGAAKPTSTKTNWLRRGVLGIALAATGLLTLGAATPAQAYWYGYYHPYYAYYPTYYGYYPGFYAGWGYGWHRGWHRHW